MLHVFAKNTNAGQHNLESLQSVKSRLYFIAPVDKLRANHSAQKFNEVLNRNQSETSDLQVP